MVHRLRSQADKTDSISYPLSLVIRIDDHANWNCAAQIRSQNAASRFRWCIMRVKSLSTSRFKQVHHPVAA